MNSSEITNTKLSSSFIRLNITQFLGAMNDNILKLLIVFCLIHINGKEHAAVINSIAGIAFVLPFLLFSAPAGCLADRFPKSLMVRLIKGVEVIVTATALIAFLSGFSNGFYVVIFMMATHSAFFAPAKYGIIPELAERSQLSRANGVIESFTYLAIIFGTTLASLLVQLASGRYWIAGIFSLLIAVLGLWSAMGIKPVAAAEPNRRISLFPSEIVRTMFSIRHDRDLVLAIAGQAYFMFIGAYVQLNVIPFGMEKLGLSEVSSGYLFLAAALGIGIGSIAAARFSGRHVEFGIVPIGAIGLTISLLLLHFLPASVISIVIALVFMGISAGLFSLPLQTFIQFKADPQKRGEVVAASSFISWIGVLLAAVSSWLLGGYLKLPASNGFIVVACITVIFSVITFWLLPDFLLRFVAILATKMCYRIKIIGEENLPTEGAALLIPNHVTWIDAFLLIATNQRRVRFVMERSIYNTPLLRRVFKFMGVIPVSSVDGKKGLLEFIKSARKALDDGYMVCIFAEGALTRNGMLREFRGGFERILKGSNYPIIPIYIGGAWGSILSYAYGHLLSRLPTLTPYPVTLIFGSPMPPTSSAADVRQTVMEMSCDYFDSRRTTRRSLEKHFVQSARRNWRRRAISDSSGKRLTYGNTLTGTLVISDKLKNIVGDSEYIGILLPSTIGGVLANLAVMLMGRIPVNLNYTASESSIKSAVKQCDISYVITSHTFLEKLPGLPKLDGMIMLEDIVPIVSKGDKLKAFLKARLFPVKILAPRKNFTADSIATVIFSSGSTGEPKGVMLSHHNIMSNIEALRMVFRLNLNDNICSALPFFHSLGFTATVWLPLVTGFSAAYHPNPMDGEKIAQLVRENKSTLLVATPTFLMAYMRRATREDFATLRIIMTGAEKLKTKLADSFQEKFGIRPMEGYGTTELSPVISLSLPDVDLGGVFQYGSKEGSVGHPIPGVAIRVVDPDTGEKLKPGNPGLMLVKGPNVMLGYIGQSEKTRDVIHEGWYNTGDIGIMDDDGFIRITDRISRFSKIGGEMVPHGVIEDELQNRIGRVGVVAVTSVPDEKKGEKLVVIFTKEAGDAGSLQRYMSESSLPNLWKPGKECYFEVEALPILGSGKLDLKGVKDIALAKLGM
ncbi:MAG: acyl-[ACP]--phospholipid O-acyltransferase [Desulfuromonadales bacterium]|nr:acyl-[ACP]--phospholipid O-acyltransferase [Desulfuromonadales bacterium]